MATFRKMLILGSAGTTLAVTLLAGTVGAPAQTPDLEQQILKSLLPPSLRSLTTTPADVSRTADRQFIDSIKNRQTRSLTLDEREHIATIAKERPSVDIEVNFDYNSAKVGPSAVLSVTALGKALTSPELQGGTFVLAGHTDAKGSLPSNQDLSEGGLQYREEARRPAAKRARNRPLVGERRGWTAI